MSKYFVPWHLITKDERSIQTSVCGIKTSGGLFINFESFLSSLCKKGIVYLLTYQAP